MCGRYQFYEEQSTEIQQIVQEVQQRCGSDHWATGEACPTMRRRSSCLRIMAHTRI